MFYLRECVISLFCVRCFSIFLRIFIVVLFFFMLLSSFVLSLCPPFQGFVIIPKPVACSRPSPGLGRFGPCWVFCWSFSGSSRTSLDKFCLLLCPLLGSRNLVLQLSSPPLLPPVGTNQPWKLTKVSLAQKCRTTLRQVKLRRSPRPQCTPYHWKGHVMSTSALLKSTLKVNQRPTFPWQLLPRFFYTHTVSFSLHICQHPVTAPQCVVDHPPPAARLPNKMRRAFDHRTQQT